MRISIMIVMVLLVTAGAAFSQTGGDESRKSYLYQWTDDQGVVHITDVGSIPQKYRDKAIIMEQSRSKEESVQPGSSPRVPDEEGADADAKAEWQLRMTNARNRLADAEQRYADLDQKRQEALGRWGGPASGQLSGPADAAQIEEQMRAVQKEIDNARREIEIVIPDEARKAGVPPGWLRE
jgi:hypothetical protein